MSKDKQPSETTQLLHSKPSLLNPSLKGNDATYGLPNSDDKHSSDSSEDSNHKTGNNKSLILELSEEELSFKRPASKSFFDSLCSFFTSCDENCQEFCVGDEEETLQGSTNKSNTDLSTSQRLRSFSTHSIN